MEECGCNKNYSNPRGQKIYARKKNPITPFLSEITWNSSKTEKMRKGKDITHREVDVWKKKKNGALKKYKEQYL